MWSGEIQTHRANLPFTLAITLGSEVEATLGKQTAVKMTSVRVRDNRVTGRMAGDLGIDYADGTPYELRFDLSRHESTLIGAAITYAVPGRDGPRLPFWVELKRGGEK
jgi:hypothetical protein